MDQARKNFWKGVGLGTLIGVTLQLGGYLLLRGDGAALGVAMFAVVPLVSGYVVAAIVRYPKRIIASCVTAGIVSLTQLVASGLEGIICAFMASPLIATGTAIGAYVGYLIRGRYLDQQPPLLKSSAILILLAPLLMAAADRLEQPYRALQSREIFTTEVQVAASPERIWESLSQMQSLDGERPFLLRVGLPVPTRCTLENPGVGARRTCYFDQGKMEQKVTEWQRPNFMGLQVTSNTLPGRHWLTFVGAEYELVAEGATTRVIRRTTIGSRLYPRWYWRPLERWGVTSEHAFVFSNLKRWTEKP